MKKIAVFIDGANIYATAKMLKLDIDYKRMLEFFGSELVRAYYYTAVKPRTDIDDPLIPLLDWLEYNGFKVVRKLTKEYIDATGQKKIKGNMDMELAVDAMEITALPGNVTDVWLFSGDGDFTHLISALQRRSIRVTVCSSIQTIDRTGQSMSVCSDELRRTADSFVDLENCRSEFARKDGMKRYV